MSNGGISDMWIATPIPGTSTVVLSQTPLSPDKIGEWKVYSLRVASLHEGAFFDCWSHERHVIPPFDVPKDWLRFRSGDWGSAFPASVGWWAVVQDDYCIPSGKLSRGALIRYREDYIAAD